MSTCKDSQLCVKIDTSIDVKLQNRHCHKKMEVKLDDGPNAIFYLNAEGYMRKAVLTTQEP